MSNEIATTEKRSLVHTYAAKMGVEPEKLLHTLKQTAFRQKNNEEISNEQMMALLVVANRYDLNPFVKEIYAYPDKGGIVPIVGVDGWARMINNHPQFDGIEFEYAAEMAKLDADHKPCPAWVKVRIFRKDRARPIEVTEFFDEVYRPPFEGTGRNGAYRVNGPWQTHTKRLLRHKGMIQAARLAFGYTGLFDEDEAERVMEQRSRDTRVEVVQSGAEVAASMTAALMAPAAPPQEPAREAIEPEDAEFTEPEAGAPAIGPEEPAPIPEDRDEAVSIMAKMDEITDEDELATLMDYASSLPLSKSKLEIIKKAYKARMAELS